MHSGLRVGFFEGSWLLGAITIRSLIRLSFHYYYFLVNEPCDLWRVSWSWLGLKHVVEASKIGWKSSHGSVCESGGGDWSADLKLSHSNLIFYCCCWISVVHTKIIKCWLVMYNCLCFKICLLLIFCYQRISWKVYEWIDWYGMGNDCGCKDS